MKENRFAATALPVHSEQQDYHNSCCRQGCQTNQNHCKVDNRMKQQICNRGMQQNGYVDLPLTTNHQICNHGIKPNGCISEQLEHPFQQHELSVGHKTLDHLERHAKEEFTDDTLLSIMEVQQQHILLQQNQILMQQKQNMVQKKGIFMLQHQVQQLLLRNGNGVNESGIKSRQPKLCEKTTPGVLQNAVKTPTRSTESVCNGPTARSSIGVMTSFLDNINDYIPNGIGIPNGIHKFNERFKSTTKLANEKFIENIGGMAEEYSYKDSMLDKINDAIKNSSAMIEYRTNGTANGCVSPNRQSDINIAAQALFYETSSTNIGCMNEQQTTDSSFALYMLGMKYDCPQDDASKINGKRDVGLKQSTRKVNDQVSVNLSPEVYDYLKRHGLLKDE